MERNGVPRILQDDVGRLPKVQSKPYGPGHTAHSVIRQDCDARTDLALGDSLDVVAVYGAIPPHSVLFRQDDFAGNVAYGGGHRGYSDFAQILEDRIPG